MKKLLFGMLVVLFLVSFVPAQGATPLATMEAHVNKVLDILRDPALKSESAKEVKKEKLRTVADKMFDDQELSRRSLARNWDKLNADERKEFVQLFRKILEKAYMDKILSYSNEKIAFDKETILADDRAEVQTRIITASKEIPIIYRVIPKDSSWRVYDVVVEGVSLVQNYRTQFNEILAKNSPQELLAILRKKVAES